MISAQREVIKKQFENAIKANPVNITLIRDIETKIGRDSYEINPTDIATFDCAIDSSKSKLSSLKSDSGDFGKIIKVKSLVMSAIYDESFQIKPNDYFMLNGLKHEIKYPNKVYDLFWECDVVVYLDD